jgi:hypothetical protein
MKHIPLILTLFFLFWGSFFRVPLLHASGTEGEESRIQIEFYGGFSMVNPADLNLRSEYDNSYERFYTEDRYSYYHSLYGDFFTYSGQIEGEFKKIKNALPFGFRLKYCVSPAISISLGFKYLSKSQDSQVTHRYDVRSINPDAVTFYDEFSSVRENDPYTLSVRGYAPLIGIHYKIGRNRSINFEGYASVGPLFAKCGFARHYRYRETNSYGYWYERTLTNEFEGKGTGIALDAGLRMNIGVLKNIDLFIEGGYSYQRAGNIIGPGSSEAGYTDLNSSGYTQSYTWEGQWAVISGYIDREWGELLYQCPANEYDGTEGFSDFSINLSGFQLRMGVSLKL